MHDIRMQTPKTVFYIPKNRVRSSSDSRKRIPLGSKIKINIAVKMFGVKFARIAQKNAYFMPSLPHFIHKFKHNLGVMPISRNEKNVQANTP
jgi:hypothetical protein